MLIAWLKLRERSLGPILDASGWAINGRMKINLPLGRSLSQVAQVPDNAQRSLHDPFAAQSWMPWVWAVLVLVLSVALMWSQGWLNRMLPASWQPTPTPTPAAATAAVAPDAPPADAAAPAAEPAATEPAAN